VLVAVSAVDVVVVVLFSFVLIVVVEISDVLAVAILSVELAITSELLTHHNIEQ